MKSWFYPVEGTQQEGGKKKNNDHDIERELSYQTLTYEPQTQVSDHAAIDLDQKEIEELLSKDFNSRVGLDNARRVYALGGHSRSYASLSLIEPVTSRIASGTTVFGNTIGGVTIVGTVEKDVEVGKDIVWFLYDVSDPWGGDDNNNNNNKINHVDCQVGGSSSPFLDGCLQSSGSILVGSVDNPTMTIDYTYDPLNDNRNGRRFDKFSNEAREKMYNCVDHCPYDDYVKFFNYYGQFEYADIFIRSAFDGHDTAIFKYGNVDFSQLSIEGRGEAIQTATVFMSLFMYIIREMEYSISKCIQIQGTATDETLLIHGWDQAFAFYTGSLLEQPSNPAASAMGGYLSYSFADRMCIKFGTCGEDGINLSGTAKVNLDIMEQFAFGQLNLMQGQCAEAKRNKVRIVQLMTIPIVQATIYQAYLIDHDTYRMNDDTRDNDNERDKDIGLGIAYVASILPYVHDCNPLDADEIYKFMNLHATNFPAVKTSLEKNYECLGIKCQDIGNLLLDVNPTSCTGPSGTGGSTSDENTKVELEVGATVGIVVAVVLVALIGATFFYITKKKSDIEFVGKASDEIEMHETVVVATPPTTTVVPTEQQNNLPESTEEQIIEPPGVASVVLT